jgi:hypothetical protein
MLFANNPTSGESALVSFGPKSQNWVEGPDPRIPNVVFGRDVNGTMSFDLPKNVDELRQKYAALTITTTPEQAQEVVVDFIKRRRRRELTTDFQVMAPIPSILSWNGCLNWVAERQTCIARLSRYEATEHRRDVKLRKIDFMMRLGIKDRSIKHGLFWCMVVLATVSFLVGLLGAQTPTNERGGDFIIFVVAATSSGYSLWLGGGRSGREFSGGSSRLVALMYILGVELLVSLDAIVTILTHPGWHIRS